MTVAAGLSDDAVAAPVATSDATVYFSLQEGFGLLIGEVCGWAALASATTARR